MFNIRAKGIQESVNPNLLSGFINVIRGMLQISANSDIESMNLSEQKLIFHVSTYPDKNLLYIARVYNKVKDKNIKKQLQKIAEVFLAKYGPQASQWKCETSLFEGFEKDLAEYLLD